VIDQAVFERLTGTVGAAFVAELIDTFIEDAAKLFATLRRALAKRDLDSFRRAAHSFKSNSEILGAARLASVARELEAIARAGSLDGVEDRLCHLESGFEIVARRLGELRRGLSV
jgi:HPt (histidine-containing phosphotransfer) domain-containing protein